MSQSKFLAAVDDTPSDGNTPSTEEWVTLFRKEFYRNGNKYSGTRLAMLKTEDGCYKVSIQLGRYCDEFDGTKFMVSFDPLEATEMLKLLPELHKKVITSRNVPLEFTEYATVEMSEFRKIRIGYKLFGNTKYICFDQDVGSRSRSVDMPRTIIPLFCETLPLMLMMVELRLDFDMQMNYYYDAISVIVSVMATDVRQKYESYLLPLATELADIKSEADKEGWPIDYAVALYVLNRDDKIYTRRMEMILHSVGFSPACATGQVEVCSVLRLKQGPDYVIPSHLDPLKKLVLHFYDADK